MDRRLIMLAVQCAPFALLAVSQTALGAGIFTTEFGCPLVVTADGGVFSSPFLGGGTCDVDQAGWSFIGSVIPAGGVVGVNSKGEVLTSSGDEYQLSTGAGCTQIGAAFVVNVFVATGLPVGGDAFVAFGDSDGGYVYATTSLGRVFRRNVKGCSVTPWEYVGSLPVGPTSSVRTSWGAVKTHYR